MKLHALGGFSMLGIAGQRAELRRLHSAVRMESFGAVQTNAVGSLHLLSVAGARAESRRAPCASLFEELAAALLAYLRGALSLCASGLAGCCERELCIRGFGFRVVRKTTATVVSLLGARGPTAILGLVSEIVLHSLKGVTNWTRPHVVQELRERVGPFRANGYPPTAVASEGWVPAIEASLLHRLPHGIESVVVKPVREIRHEAML